MSTTSILNNSPISPICVDFFITSFVISCVTFEGIRGNNVSWGTLFKSTGKLHNSCLLSPLPHAPLVRHTLVVLVNLTQNNKFTILPFTSRIFQTWNNIQIDDYEINKAVDLYIWCPEYSRTIIQNISIFGNFIYIYIYIYMASLRKQVLPKYKTRLTDFSFYQGE